VILWSLPIYGAHLLRENIGIMLGEQQLSTVSLVANNIDLELANRFKALELDAKRIGPAMADNPAGLKSFFEGMPTIQSLFNGGIMIHSLDGTVIVDVPRSGRRIGVNYMDRAEVVAAIKEGNSTIGKPHLAKQLGNPEFAMAVPIRDPQGKVIGVLRGEINLSQPNFIDQINTNHYGKTGGYVLIAPQHRLVVSATDKSRIVQRLPAAGVNAMTDRFVQGYEGSIVGRNSLGVDVLASAKRIPTANWYLAASLPTAEAFSPIHVADQRMLLATILMTLLAGVLTWWVLKRQFSPMVDAVTQLAKQEAADQPLQALPISRADEIGELIGGFNRLLDTLAKRETALKESEYRFKALHEAAFGGIMVHERGIILDCNQGLSELTGYAIDELIGMDGLRLIAPDWLDVVVAHIRDGSEKPYEVEGFRKNGDRYALSIRSRNFSYMDRSVRATDFRDITERKAAEAEIELYRNHLESLVQERTADLRKAHKELLETQFAMDNVGIGIRRADARTGRFLYANKIAAEGFGYTVEEMLSMTAADLDPKLDATHFQQIDELLRTQGKAQFESVNQTKNGRLVPVEVILHYNAGDAETSVNIIAFVTDITERKKAEAHLRRLSQAVEQSLASIIITDAQGVIQYVNPAFTRTSGYSEQQAVGNTPRLLKSGVHDAQFYEHLWQTISNGEVWNGELANKKLNGDLYWVQASISPILNRSDGKNEILGFVGIVDDITEQKLTLMQLHESEERFHQAFVHAPFGIAVVSLDLIVNEANPALCNMLGFGNGELNGRALDQIFLLENSDKNNFSLEPLTDGGFSTSSVERLAIHKDGRHFPVVNTLSVVCDANDHPRNFVVQVEDISERKQVRLRELAKGILAAQEKDRAQISHELHDEIGQSLTALKITLKRAGKNLMNQDKAASCLDDGQQILERLMQEVRGIAYRLRPSELDQLGLVAALRSHLDKTIRPLGIEVTLNENVGEARLTESLELCCFRVVQEAVTNSLRHAQATHLEVSLNWEPPYLRISIKDNGVGMDVLHQYSSQEKPTSLGLVGMRERVADNGGQLHIHSTRAGGTEVIATFDFTGEFR